MFLETLMLGALALSPATAGDTGSCSSTSSHVASTPTIVETAQKAKLNTLVAAVQAADLAEALSGKGPFTVFAPTEEAFAALPEGQLEMLLQPKNKHVLQAILKYHVVSGELDAKHVIKTPFATTLNGQRIDIKVDDSGVKIDGARVLKTDIKCSNGVVHLIDRVILPNTEDIVATAMGAGDFNTLTAALKAAELVEALRGDGPLTVFAPTDAAFAKLPKGAVADLLKPENRSQLQAVLTYHVVPGRVYSDAVKKEARVESLQGGTLHLARDEHGVTVAGARVVKADIETANGVIHVIDSVLLPQ